MRAVAWGIGIPAGLEGGAAKPTPPPRVPTRNTITVRWDSRKRSPGHHIDAPSPGCSRAGPASRSDGPGFPRRFSFPTGQPPTSAALVRLPGRIARLSPRKSGFPVREPRPAPRRFSLPTGQPIVDRKRGRTPVPIVPWPTLAAAEGGRLTATCVFLL
ncbi:hypothetical protein ABZ912_17290 [Nonomuraea angiospora]|uniref:hypothetical protein n=1 Tax=Nonomuraea angiospora TaxID=46172 RepID=UPI0033CAA9DF